MSCTLDFMDTREALMRWVLACEEVEVDELREKVRAAHGFELASH